MMNNLTKHITYGEKTTFADDFNVTLTADTIEKKKDTMINVINQVEN